LHQVCGEWLFRQVLIFVFLFRNIFHNEGYANSNNSPSDGWAGQTRARHVVIGLQRMTRRASPTILLTARGIFLPGQDDDWKPNVTSMMIMHLFVTDHLP
jgi:hypothetical protein